MYGIYLKTAFVTMETLAAAEVEHGRRRGTPKSIRTGLNTLLFMHINVAECFVSPFLASEELVTENPRKGQVRFAALCR